MNPQKALDENLNEVVERSLADYEHSDQDDDTNLKIIELAREELKPSINVIDTETCIICRKEKSTLLLNDCRHICLCESCAKTAIHKMRKCPLCGRTIINIIRFIEKEKKDKILDVNDKVIVTNENTTQYNANTFCSSRVCCSSPHQFRLIRERQERIIYAINILTERLECIHLNRNLIYEDSTDSTD